MRMLVVDGWAHSVGYNTVQVDHPAVGTLNAETDDLHTAGSTALARTKGIQADPLILKGW